MTPSDFIKIHDLALVSILEPDMTFHYRSICRWYSEKFHTPLHIVERELPVQYVLTHYYEAQLSNMEDEDLDNLIKKAVDPNWDEDTEEDIQRFIESIEDEIREKKDKEKQSSKGKSDASGALNAKVSKTYDEPPPPEANSNPDSVLDSTLVLSDQDLDSNFDQD